MSEFYEKSIEILSRKLVSSFERFAKNFKIVIGLVVQETSIIVLNFDKTVLSKKHESQFKKFNSSIPCKKLESLI